MSEDPEENTGGQPVRTPRASDPLTVTRLARRGTQVAAVALTVLATIFLLKYDKDAKSAAYQAGQCAAVCAVIMWSRAIGTAGQVAHAELVLELRGEVAALRKQQAADRRHFDARLNVLDEAEAEQLGLFGATVRAAKDDLVKRRNGHGPAR